MSYIKRDMEKIVVELTEQYPAILISGPRQVGKTTMLQNLMEGKNRTYVSLDDLNIRALAKSDPAMFFQIYKTPIFIDEVQYAPELFTYIKVMVDKNHQPGEFWLTGSQIFKLMQGVQESLAGRVAVLNLSSLSQNEIYNSCSNVPFTTDFEALCDRQKAIKAATTPEIYKRIFIGGMPAIVSGKYKDSNIFYMSYLSTYLVRDVKELSGSIESLKFMKFITAVACRTSQMVNYADIARDADIKQVTAKNWLSILETLGIIFYLHPYSNNILKRAIKTPKLYFYDTGLCTYLTKWSSPETLESGAMNGAVLENYVVGEIFKSYNNSAKTPFIYYYRDKDMKEIDLIIEADGRLSPIEIKKTASPASQLTNVFKTLDRANIERGNGAVLCLKEELMAFDSQNYIIPISLI
ncbi:ATPase [Desulfosporosinus sp. Tol-M]|nr:ATPase [Desulfosporosinus sp. Tol-M]